MVYGNCNATISNYSLVYHILARDQYWWVIAQAINNHKAYGKHRVCGIVLAQALFLPQTCISAETHISGDE